MTTAAPARLDVMVLITSTTGVSRVTRASWIVPAHDLVDFQQEGTAQLTAGVEAGEVFLIRKPRASNRTMARASPMTNMVVVLEVGGEIEGTALLRDLHVEDSIGSLGEGGVQPARDGDDFRIEAGDGGKNIDQYGLDGAARQGCYGFRG